MDQLDALRHELTNGHHKANGFAIARSINNGLSKAARIPKANAIAKTPRLPKINGAAKTNGSRADYLPG
jgi:hypothetical protein